MNLTSDIYSEFSKILGAIISWGRFCLSISQEITLYWCDLFYFSERSIWHSKEWFSVKFLVRRGTRNHCTAYLKKHTIPLYEKRQFVMYRLKIVTHIYKQILFAICQDLWSNIFIFKWSKLLCKCILSERLHNNLTGSDILLFYIIPKYSIDFVLHLHYMNLLYCYTCFY